jgi:hypothetical protein
MSDGTPNGGGHPVVGRAAVGNTAGSQSGYGTQTDETEDETAVSTPTSGASGNGTSPTSSSGDSGSSSTPSSEAGRASVPSTATQTINVPPAFGGNGSSRSAGTTGSSSYLGGDSGSSSGSSSSGSSFGSSSSSFGSSSSYDSSSYEGSSYDDNPAPAGGESNYGFTEQSGPSYGIPPSSTTIGTSYGPDPAGATGTASVGSSNPLGRAVRSAKNTMQAAAARGPRRARLQLRRIDPWSVLKFSLAVSAVLLIVFVVATTAIYVVLWSMGVFDAVNNTIKTFTAGDNSGSGVDLTISPQLVIGGAAVIGLINVVLFSALATIGAFIYNVCADLVGGIEITLAERD